MAEYSENSEIQQSDISLLEIHHFMEWCNVNGYKYDLMHIDAKLWKKFKIDTLLSSEDGGFKFKFNTIQDYFIDQWTTALQQEIADEIDKQTIKKCKDACTNGIEKYIREQFEKEYIPLKL